MARGGRPKGPRLCRVTVWLVEDDWKWLLAMRYRGDASATLRQLVAEYRAEFEAVEKTRRRSARRFGGLVTESVALIAG